MNETPIAAIQQTSLMKKILLPAGMILAVVIALAFSLPAARVQADYTVHEWGTFTSVAGGDGKLLEWTPQVTSELPGFVHAWSRPGLNRYGTSRYINKGDMVTLQRLETPVIYFYSKTNLAVEVSVDFPKGVITEWYPQASQIGPSRPAGTNPPVTRTTLAESRAVWKNLHVAPAPEKLPNPALTLPEDKKGSHYFAARATTANYLQMDFPGESNAPSEIEKFIFYRGAGGFQTPLRVTVNDASDVAVENSGGQKLSHLILASIHNGQGAFAVMDELPAGKSAAWLNLNTSDVGKWKHIALPDFQNEIVAQMESALTGDGLFADEAKAMVNTWKDSWFTEEGERVLYILPRTWTDEILPLMLNPSPTNLTRVMVGRAEIITPAAEKHLREDLVKVQKNHSQSPNQVEADLVADLRAFGRFAPPALNLIISHGGSATAFSIGQTFLSVANTKESAAESARVPAKFE